MWKLCRYQMFFSLYMYASSIHMIISSITVNATEAKTVGRPMLVLLCSGDADGRKFLAIPWVMCFIKGLSSPKVPFLFCHLYPHWNCTLCFGKIMAPATHPGQAQPFYIRVMQPLLLWVFFFFSSQKKAGPKRHSVLCELSSMCIRQSYFQKKSVVIVCSSCFTTAFSAGHQVGS